MSGLGGMGPAETVQIVQTGADSVSIALTGGVAAAVIYARQVAEIVHKLIPDNRKGWLGTVRKVAGVLAGYARNREK